MLRRLQVALGCLTILPFGPSRSADDADVGGSFLWFPLVGLLIGAILVGVLRAASQCMPTPAAAALVLAAWVLITGALHLDGFGDVCDGFYGGRTREERLRIMKDPHVGVMAIVGLVVLLILKFALIESLGLRAAGLALLIIPCLSRSLMVLLGTTLPYARPAGGTAAAFVRHGRRSSLIGAGLMALAAAWWLGGIVGLWLFAATVIVGLLLRWVFLEMLGGITGDGLGASGELIEVVLLAIAVFGAAR